VLNGGRALVTLDLRLHVMRWTRFLYSSANSLPAAVEIDLKGIPAHAWDYKTAQLLLSDHCSISGLQPLNENRRDVFRVAAWCSDPGQIPSEMVLEIVEPSPATGDPATARRTLSYPVTISVSPYELPSSSGDSPPPAPVDDNRQGHRRRRNPSSPRSSARRAASSPPTNHGSRASVHARLGPLPATSHHVATTDRRVNSAPATSLGPASCMSPVSRGPEELVRPSPEATPAVLMKASSRCSPALEAPPLPQPLSAAADLPFLPGPSSPPLGADGPEVAGSDCDLAAAGLEDSGLVEPGFGDTI